MSAPEVLWKAFGVALVIVGALVCVLVAEAMAVSWVVTES